MATRRFIKDLEITNAKLVNASVYTLKIENEEVQLEDLKQRTISGAASDGDVLKLTDVLNNNATTSWQTIVSGTLEVLDNRKVLISFGTLGTDVGSGYWNVSRSGGTSNPISEMRVTRAGNQIRAVKHEFVDANAGASFQQLPVGFAFVDNPGNGTHTYALQHRVQGTATGVNSQTNHVELVAHAI